MKRKSRRASGSMKKIALQGFSLLGLAAVLCFPLPLFHGELHTPPKNHTEKSVSFNPGPRFEKNAGQTDPEVDFLCRGESHILYLTSTGSILHLLGDGGNRRSIPLRMELPGSNPRSEASGFDEMKSKSNYYTGSDPDSWITGVPHYSKVGYLDIYNGIDMVYYFNDDKLEFDFNVSPGADPEQIRLSFSGADKFEKDGNGNLSVSAGGHELVFNKPSAWQEKAGRKQEVEVQFAVLDGGNIRFDIGSYDTNAGLTIDPQIVYATYLGGSKSESGNGIAVDRFGCAYVTGSTSSTDFPVWKAHQGTMYPGSTYSDIFVTKMNPEGNDIIYSTYIGGKYTESGDAIAVDSRCRVCITGRTGSGAYDSTPESERFPLKNALRRITGDSQNAFVSVLDSTGILIYSTYLGGEYEDWGADIAVDASGCVYVTGTTFSFPPEFPIKNAFMTKKPSYYFDPFMTKIDPSKSGEASLVYSTYVGGEHDDYGYGIAVDGNGCAYVTGQATDNFPTTPNAIQSEYKGKGDVFITKIDTKRSGAESLVYSTYLGDENSNSGSAIEVDASGFAYVSGSAAIPATPGAFSSTSISFICKLNASGSGFVYLARVLSGNCLALDAEGNVYTVLITDFGKGRKVLALNTDGTDTLFTQRTTAGSDLAVDADGAVYVVGGTNADGLATANAFKKNLAGSYDAFIEKWYPKEMLLVKVLADPREHLHQRIRNTPVDLYSIDLANRTAPLAFLARKTTDQKGVIRLPVGTFRPGMPILIRATPERKPAAKSGRTEKTSCMYKVYVDNLAVGQDGGIIAQCLESDPADTTEMYMEHTSVAFSLVASIAWLASPEYVANLKSCFRKASNLLYDVSNGQAYIDTVAIFDNSDRWSEADIRFFASNMQWPMAMVSGISFSSIGHVYMPPAFYGSGQTAAQAIFDDDPIDASQYLTFSSIVHELGHYAFGFFDEYCNALRMSVYPEVNFGYMDNNYYLNDPAATEMSDHRQGDPLFQKYFWTQQYSLRWGSCWETFESGFNRTYGDVIASIHGPRDFGIRPNRFMEGPNSDPDNPDFSVGDMMGFDVRAVTTTNPRTVCLCENQWGQPMPGVHVTLEKKGRLMGMHHGKSTATGHIKLFNVEAGDVIYATHQSGSHFGVCFKPVSPSLPKAGGAALKLELRAISGRFSMLSGIAFDASGNLMYRCEADPAFPAPPSIRVVDGVSPSENQALTQSAGTYSAVIGKTGFSEGSVFFTAKDSLGEAFFVSQNAFTKNTGELSGGYSHAGMHLELALTDSETTAEKLAVLASAFPAPAKGLPDSVRRVSDVIALNVHPEGSALKGLIQLHYFADSLEAEAPEAVQIHRWQNGWIPLTTGVDLVHNTVAATIEGPGIFAAFLDLTRSRVTGVFKGIDPKTPAGWMLHPNYPNPFNPSTRIRYDVPDRSHVKIEVFDMLGRKIRTMADYMHAAGSYTAAWDGRDDHAAAVPAGIYIVRIQTDQFMQSRKMILIR